MLQLKKYCFIAYIIAGVYTLTGCSQILPFVDARREAGSVTPFGSSTEKFPAICYGLFGSQEDIEALAVNECAKTGKKAEFLRKENFSCRLLTPQKAIYKCVETTDPVPAYQPACPAD